jgi:Uma2 family endonuclease
MSSTAPTTPPPAAVPPLEAGLRLTRAEFERRYEAMPHLKKAELIDGVVFMPSPVRIRHHASPHSDLMACLGVYRIHTPGVRCADNGTLRLDEANEPQPDAALWVEHGGRAQIDADDYLAGAPELVAEVSASRVGAALGQRLEAYRRNGVREYLVWRADDAAIDWFVLRNGQYDRLPPAGGVYRSEAFPALWLDPAALVAGDLPAMNRVLQEGLASPEHAAFVARLQSGAAGTP